MLTGNTITFSSDDVADVTTLSPNPFRLTLTLSLADYPTKTYTQDISLGIVCEVINLTFDTLIALSTSLDIVLDNYS